MAFTEQDIECMSLALKLSELGRSDVGANPMVGCVITRDDKIIAQDYHQLYGEGHAEINALNKLIMKQIIQNSTLPLSHAHIMEKRLHALMH